MKSLFTLGFIIIIVRGLGGWVHSSLWLRKLPLLLVRLLPLPVILLRLLLVLGLGLGLLRYGWGCRLLLRLMLLLMSRPLLIILSLPLPLIHVDHSPWRPIGGCRNRGPRAVLIWSARGAIPSPIELFVHIDPSCARLRLSCGMRGLPNIVELNESEFQGYERTG